MLREANKTGDFAKTVAPFRTNSHGMVHQVGQAFLPVHADRHECLSYRATVAASG